MAISRQDAYRFHREQFFEKLPDNCIAIVANPKPKIRNHDVEYDYRSDSNFQYLTDFPEPETVAVFIKQGDKKTYCLFCQPKDPAKEIWTGKRIGTTMAQERYGADEAYDISALPSKLQSWLGKGCALSVWTPIEEKGSLPEVAQYLPSGTALYNLKPVLQMLRDVKGHYELQALRAAARASVAGHQTAWRLIKPGMTEKQVQVSLMAVFLARANHHGLAYPCIVAGGNNANTLHYEKNDQVLEDGKLVLIDAAAETEEGYASDITRTVPVNGRFTEAQARVYQKVLDIQEVLIAMCVPGVDFYDIQRQMGKLATAALVDLGILHGKVETLYQNKAYQKYLPHGFGHWVGLDVHDDVPYLSDPALPTKPTIVTGQLAQLKATIQQMLSAWYTKLCQWLGLPQPEAKPTMPDILVRKGRQLRVNHVLTVEPGLYLPEEDMDVPEAYRGIGVRIEDVVRVREEGKGPEILTAALPKQIKDIEQTMRSEIEDSASRAPLRLFLNR